MLELILNKLLDSNNIVAAVMGVGLWWFSRSHTELVKSITDERSAHLDRLEKDSEECKADRKDLRAKYETLLSSK